MRKVKIKSLPKAQKMGEFKPSYDFNISALENMELNRRAKAAGWNSVDEYRNANWAYNTQPSKPSNLLSELTKENNSKFAVSESTNANPILPRHWTDEAGKQRSASEIKAVEADWEKAHQEQLAAEKERLKKEHEEYKRKQQEFAKEQFGVDLAQLENYEKDDQGQWIPKTERTRQLEARGNDFALGYTAAENVERKNNLPTVGEELIDLAEEIPFALLGTGAYSQAFRALRGARNAAPAFGALAPEIMLAEEPAAGIFESGINLSRPARSAPKPRKPSFDVQPFTEHLSIMNNPYRLKENTLEGILAKINAGDKYGKQFKSIRYTNNPNKGDIALMIAKDESGAPFFYFKANMDNPLHAGRAFSKLDEFIPKGWSIQEPHSLSLDSWSSMMRRAKSGKFAWENAGHVPLNQSAVHRAGTFSDYVIPETMTSGYGADKYYFSNVESAQPYLDKLRGLIPKEITGVRPALGSEYFPGAVAREYQFLQVPNLRLTKLLRGGDISMGIIEQKLDKFALGGPNDPTKPRGRESDFKYKIIEGKYAFTLPDGRPYIVDNEDTANKLSKFIKSGKWGWINEEDGHGYSFGRLRSDSEPKAPMVLKKEDLGKPDFAYQITPTYGKLANLIYNPRVYTSDYNGANIDTEWGNRSGSNLMYTEPYQEKQFYKNQVSPDYENISLKPRARGNYAYSVIIDGEEYSVDHPYEGSHKGYGYVNIPNRGEFEIDYRSGKPELKKAPTRLNNGGDISIPDLRRVKISQLPKHQDTGVVSGKPYAYTANSVGAPNQWVTLPDFSENSMYQVNLKNTNNKQAIDGYVKNQNGQLLSTFPMENVAWEMPEVTVQAKRYTPEEIQRARQAYLQTPEGREEERQRLMQEFVDQQNANKSSLQAAMGNLSLDNPATRDAARNYADYKLGISSPMWGTDKLLTGRNEPTTRDFYRPHESTLSFGVPAAAVTLPIVAEAVPTALSALRPYSQALNNSLNTKLFGNPSIWASPTQQALYNLATPGNILRTVGTYDLTHKYLPDAYGDFKNYYITGDPESLKSGLYNSGKGILELGTMTGPIQNEMSMIKRPVSLVDDARKLEKAEDLGSQTWYSLKSFKNILDLARKKGGSIPKAQSEGEIDYFTAAKRLHDEKDRINQMRNQIIPIAISHDATSDNRPFHVRLPEDQPYCTTRACEAEREAGFPVKQVASGYKLMKELTPEQGWYPTSYDQLLPGDMAQVVRNSGFGHTMISTGDVSNMPEQWRGNADPNQKGFYWDNGSGQDFQFASPKSEDQLARWMDNVKRMNYYTYKGNLPQYEKEYQQAVHNYLHDTSEGDYGPMVPIDAIPHKKQGGVTDPPNTTNPEKPYYGSTIGKPSKPYQVINNQYVFTLPDGTTWSTTNRNHADSLNAYFEHGWGFTGERTADGDPAWARIPKTPPQPEPATPVQTIPVSKDNYTLYYSGNPGVAYLHAKIDNGDGTFTRKNLGATEVSKWLTDEQQKQFHSPGGGMVRVNYNPDIKIYSDVKEAINAMSHKKQGGAVKKVKIKSLPKNWKTK